MFIQLTDTYRITSDKLNIILEEKFEKRDGKGKNAPLTGEFDYRPIAYFRELKHLADSLIKREIINSDVTDLYDIVYKVDELRNDIVKHLVDKIVLINDKKDKEE